MHDTLVDHPTKSHFEILFTTGKLLTISNSQIIFLLINSFSVEFGSKFIPESHNLGGYKAHAKLPCNSGINQMIILAADWLEVWKLAFVITSFCNYVISDFYVGKYIGLKMGE